MRWSGDNTRVAGTPAGFYGLACMGSIERLDIMVLCKRDTEKVRI